MIHTTVYTWRGRWCFIFIFIEISVQHIFSPAKLFQNMILKSVHHICTTAGVGFLRIVVNLVNVTCPEIGNSTFFWEASIHYLFWCILFEHNSFLFFFYFLKIKHFRNLFSTCPCLSAVTSSSQSKRSNGGGSLVARQTAEQSWVRIRHFPQWSLCDTVNLKVERETSPWGQKRKQNICVLFDLYLILQCRMVFFTFFQTDNQCCGA